MYDITASIFFDDSWIFLVFNHLKLKLVAFYPMFLIDFHRYMFGLIPSDSAFNAVQYELTILEEVCEVTISSHVCWSKGLER